MTITYLPYKKIDKDKWNDCINHAVNGLIYAETAYLDHMSENWDGLVLGDYEAVMPLTWKSKFSIRYMYQPPFTQQGGIYFKNTCSDINPDDFLKIATTHFKFAEFSLNHFNAFDPSNEKVITSQRNNFILKLGAGYKNIFSNYNNYIKHRLSRLKKFKLVYKHAENYSEAINLYRDLYKERIGGMTTKDYGRFEKLCKFLALNKRVIIRQAFNNDGTELLAVILLLKDNKRLYNIVSCILPKGKKLLANYFLYDAVIREFSSENFTLDFEGSDIPGIAFFYKKFAGENQPYPFIKFNNLPLPIKLLKN